VAGGGINLAQRVMDCGDAGHILVSKTLGDILSQLSDWAPSLHDLGEHEVKHGVKIHLVNLYTDKVGNPAMPRKLDGKAVGAGVGTPPAVLPAKSYRALYMLTGSVLTLAILAFAGIEVADWLKTSAKNGVQPIAPATTSAPAATTPKTPAPVPALQPSRSEPAPKPTREETARAVINSAPQAEPSKPLALPASTPPSLELPKTEPPKAVLSAAQRAELDELQRRMILLEARAGAVRGSLQNLQAQQARSGLSLRGDMAAANQGMERLMAAASAALKAEDPTALKQNLDMAEQQVEKLENFLHL